MVPVDQVSVAVECDPLMGRLMLALPHLFGEAGDMLLTDAPVAARGL
jgi:hypothetical protein